MIRLKSHFEEDEEARSGFYVKSGLLELNGQLSDCSGSFGPLSLSYN